MLWLEQPAIARSPRDPDHDLAHRSQLGFNGSPALFARKNVYSRKSCSLDTLVFIRRREREHWHFPPQNISFRVFTAHFLAVWKSPPEFLAHIPSCRERTGVELGTKFTAFVQSGQSGISRAMVRLPKGGGRFASSPQLSRQRLVGAAFEVIGSATKNVEPCPSADSSQMRPPCCSTSSRQR
jgi:hypothetical protein